MGRSGIAAVEAAVALPVVLLFLIAAVNLGRLAKVSDSLTNAAHNGTQYGSANTTAAADSASIRNAAVTEMQNLPNVSASNPTVTATTVTNSGTNYIQITVTYDLTGIAFFKLFPINSMTRTVQMVMMPQ